MATLSAHGPPLLLSALLIAGCGGDSSGDAGPDAPVRTCVPPPGTTGSPQTIEESLALINALPKPTSLACYLESLDRPLKVVATKSLFSAQPAQGERSPRLFIFSGPLVSSIAPEGPGAALLEYGQFGAGLDSLKGEIEFPVEQPLPPEAPYSRIMFDEGRTSCSFCHANEQPSFLVGTARGFTSAALRPQSSERVPLDDVRREAERCDPSAEPERCALLRALFDHGELREHAFPADLPTIFDK